MDRKVSFYNDGLKLSGILYEPEGIGDRSCPGIVMCQGRAGAKEYYWFPYIANRLEALGYVVLIWDYRGIGESEGEPGRLYPMEQVSDIRSALTFLELCQKVDSQRLALFGMSYGGALVPYAAAVDQRVRCAISVAGWGDGERWMRDLRGHWEWLELLERIAKDKKSRTLTGKPEPMIPKDTPADSPSSMEVRKRVIQTVPGMEGFKSAPTSLANMEKILEFKPVEVVGHISPRAILYIAAEKDTTTPVEGVIEMYDKTNEPKKLWVIPGISHYNFYEDPYLGQVIDTSIDWLRQHLHMA